MGMNTLALPSALLLYVHYVCSATCRALDSIRPANTGNELDSYALVCEELNCFAQRFGVVLFCIHDAIVLD